MIEREVKFKISAITDGGDDIRRMAKEVDDLAKSGGDAAPAFQKLSAELNELAKQQDAIAQLARLRNEVADTSLAFATASTRVGSLATALQAQKQETATFIAQQTAAKQALRATTAELQSTEAQLRTYAADSDKAAKSTSAYTAETLRLDGVIVRLKNTQIAQKTALKDVTEDTGKSVSALAKADAAYTKASNAAAKLNDVLVKQQSALDKAGDAATAAGVDAANLATAQARVVTTVESLSAAHATAVKSAQALAASQAAQVAAAKALTQANKEEALAIKQTTDAIEQANAAMSNAFGKTGVRSLEAIKNEAKQVELALILIKKQFESGAISAESFSRAVAGSRVKLAELQREAATLPSLPGVFQRINSAISGVVTRFGALAAAMGVVGFAVKPVYDLAVQIDTLRRALTTITGSAKEAERQIAFLRDTANFSGIAIGDISDSFIRFTASMRATGVSSAETQKIFSAVANAAGNLGLSTDKASHILDALSQMANKGTVSMEELRQQAGEHLPGALSLMAKGLGITESQLIKMVESGQLLTTHALIPLANAMVALGSKDKQVEGLQASFNRLKNAVRDALQQVTDSSAFKQLSVVIDALARNFGTVTEAVYAFGKAFLAIKLVGAITSFLGFGKAATQAAIQIDIATGATAANSLATGTNTGIVGANTAAKIANAAASSSAAAAIAAMSVVQKTANAAAFTDLGLGVAALGSTGKAAADAAAKTNIFARAFGAAGTVIGGVARVFGGIPGLILTVLLSYKELEKGLFFVLDKVSGLSKGLEESRAQLAAQKKAAQEAASANEALGSGWVKAAADYATALKPILANVQASEKLAAAKKEEGETLVRLAGLTGSETEGLNASSVAAIRNEDASLRVAAAKRLQVEALEQVIAKQLADAAMRGGMTKDEEAYIALQKDKLLVQQAEVAQANATVEAMHAQVVMTGLAVKAYQDNANSLDELRQAYEDAANRAAILKRAVAEGVVPQEQSTRAIEAAAVAQNQYRDALADSLQVAERQKTSAEVYSRVVGETAQSLGLATAAAENYADTVGRTTKMYEQQAAALRENLVETEKLAKAQGDADGKLKALAAELRTKIGLMDTEIARSKQSAQASKDEATARKLLSDSYKDNSSKLGQLASAAHAAQAELARLIELQKQGKATADEVAAATRNAATAMGLYADALHDTTVNLQNQILMDQAHATQISANLRLKAEEVRTEEALARAKGDEVAITEVQIRAKNVEIDTRRASANAMRAEADGTIALAEQQRRELEQTGRLTPEKAAEIEARILNAQAKRTEASATEETIKQIRAEIDALKALESQKSSGGGTKYNKQNQALDTEGNVLSMLTVSPPWADKDGNWFYTDKDGQLRRSGMKPATKDDKGNWVDKQGSAGVAGSGASAGTASTAGAGSGLPTMGGGNAGAGGVNTAMPVQKVAAGSTHTVNIVLNGKSTPISTASAGDAQALAAMLKQLESDMSRAAA